MQSHEILLESGTNELELLAFLLGDQPFGVNVAKVQSIVQYDSSKVTEIPESPSSMLGMLLYRDKTIPLIDLSKSLGLDTRVSSSKQIVIVTEFNNILSGYKVDGVNRIHRISWDDFIPMGIFLSKSAASIIGSVQIEDNDVLVIDMEYILSKIVPSLSFEEVTTETLEMSGKMKRENVRIYFAEDSFTIRNNVTRVLQKTGYINIQAFKNGQDAYETLAKIWDQAKPIDQKSIDLPHVVISDIEMPKMDGLTLCKKTKVDLGLDQIPFIMFSSLINEQMTAKCESVGADMYVAKPEMNKLIAMLDKTCLQP